jgi:hypothetical protein
MPGLSIADRLASVGAQNANATAAVNTAVVATFGAVAGMRHNLIGCTVSYSAAPTGGRLTVADGGTTVYDVDIIAGGPTPIPLPAGGIVGTVGNAMTVTLAAAGAAVVGKLNTQRISL